MKIINQSVPPALKNLGYSESEIKDILDYVIGKASLVEAPHINWKTLKKKGLTDAELEKIELKLSSAFSIQMVFNKHSLGESVMERLHIEADIYNDASFDFLRHIGFTEKEIEAANEYVCGTMTIEGAPHIKAEHLPIFDCASRCGAKGKRFIHYLGHIRMLAAVQPFISGAISKTINMPNEVSEDEVLEAYKQSWKLALKANAIYRDGCKLSQPLNTTSKSKKSEPAQKVEIKEVEITKRPLRRKLNEERQSITHKFAIAGHEGYFTVGLYDDGTPGELFVKMSKEGSTLSGIMDALALSISLNLQYGVPLEVLISKFTHSRFEPAGMTSNKEIPMVKSIMDYMGRWLAVKFLDKDTAKKYHNGQLIDKAYDEGTMSSKGTLPNIRKVISLSTPAEKDESDELHLIKALESAQSTITVSKAKIQEKKVAVAVNASHHGTPHAFQNDDAPMCHNCGAAMIRNGTCYKCLDCGETSGCS